MAKNKWGWASRLAGWRGWIQAAFLLAWLDPWLLRLHTICGPVFHCYSCPLATFGCPIGILANFSALHLIPFAALGTLVVVGALVGSFVCGWACPFGFLQDLLARIPTPEIHAARLDRLSALRRARGLRAVDSVSLGRGASLVYLPAVSGRRHRGRPALHGPTGRHRPAVGLAHGYEDHDPRRADCGCALHLAAVVHVVLPAGRDLRTLESRLICIPPIPSRSLSGVCRLPQSVSRQYAGRAASGWSAVRALSGMHPLPGGDSGYRAGTSSRQRGW